VSSNEDDLRSLRDMLGKEQWIVRYAQTCHEARYWMEREKPAVVACERALPDGTWKDLHRMATSMAHPPPVVVVSRHADENLWAEVLNLGGYDVLATPLEKNEVSRVMEMASRHGRPIP
jgi:DNA-binding NtrC family response regulator